jgi:hypothetical protein
VSGQAVQPVEVTIRAHSPERSMTCTGTPASIGTAFVRSDVG